MKMSRLAVLILAVVGMACGSNDNELATLQVALVDSPGDYESVNIEIVDVQINAGTDEEGFESLENVNTGVFDLLELTGGLEAILADVQLPAGNLSQIRLILGEGNTLGLNGDEIDLTVPSGSQSGLKLNVNMELEAGITYKLLLDFDAARSVVEAGNSGRFNLKPVIRTSAEATSGAIRGSVQPIESSVAYAIIGVDTVASSFTNDLGEFLIRGVDAGTYLVSVVPNSESGLTTVDLTDVEVSIGEVSDVGELTLE